MFCPNCGKEVDNVKFCPACGTAIAVEQKSQIIDEVQNKEDVVSETAQKAEKKTKKEKKEKKPRNNKKLIITIVSVVLVIAILVGAFFIVKPFLNKKDEEEKTATTPTIELDVSTHSLLLYEEENTVCFYAVSDKKLDEVILYNSKTDKKVAEMLDDGSGYDEEADDMIYTAFTTIDVEEEESFYFVAKTKKEQSDIEIVSVIAPLTDSELDDIEVVDMAVDELMLDDGFYDLSYEERKEKALETINDLADRELIDEKTIYEDDENECITFYYASGVIGMIDLQDRVSGEEALANNSSSTSQEMDNTTTDGTTIVENETEVVNAKFLYAWYSQGTYDKGIDLYTTFRDDLQEVADLSTAYGFNTVFDEEVTIEDIKNLSEDNFVNISAHGGYMTFEYGTGEKYWFFFEKKARITTSAFELLEKATKEKNKTYSKDLKSGRIVKAGSRYRILPAFFDEHYGRKDLEDTIIYFGSCQIMGKNGKFNEDWSKVLTSKSIKAFTAYHNSVYIMYGHEMCSDMIGALFEGKTMSQAVDYAKEENGKDDNVWYEKGNNEKSDKTAAYINLRGDSDARLVSIIGSVRGKVADAINKTPLTSAQITVYKTGEDEKLKTVSTDQSGNFMVDLEEGEYRISVSASGYLQCEIGSVTIEKGCTTYLENTILLTKMDDNPVSVVSGTVTNAVTDEKVQGAVISFRKDWGNKSGEFVKSDGKVIKVITDENGYYFTDKLPYGYYTIEIVCDNFAKQYVNVIATNDATASQNQNIVLAPEAHGNDFRITLEWEENPRDEDAHIVGDTPHSYHVYYSHKSEYSGDELIANLDHDDTRGNGFETVTLTVDPEGIYSYYVYHYAGDGSLSTSNAVVKVYQGGVMIKQYNVPVDQGTGRYWNVFNIINGRVVTINRISDSSAQ